MQSETTLSAIRCTLSPSFAPPNSVCAAVPPRQINRSFARPSPKLDTRGTANQTSSFGNPRAKYSRLHVTGYGIRRPVSSRVSSPLIPEFPPQVVIRWRQSRATVTRPRDFLLREAGVGGGGEKGRNPDRARTPCGRSLSEMLTLSLGFSRSLRLSIGPE